MGEPHTESMLASLVRSTAEAFAYARLYGRPITEASDVGRQEALDAMTAEDVFQALDIVLSKPAQTDRRPSDGE